MIAAVFAAGSENAAAHRLGLSDSTVKYHLASGRSKVVGGDHGPAGSDPGASAGHADAAQTSVRRSNLPDRATRLVGPSDSGKRSLYRSLSALGPDD